LAINFKPRYKFMILSRGVRRDNRFDWFYSVFQRLHSPQCRAPGRHTCLKVWGGAFRWNLPRGVLRNT